MFFFFLFYSYFYSQQILFIVLLIFHFYFSLELNDKKEHQRIALCEIQKKKEKKYFVEKGEHEHIQNHAVIGILHRSQIQAMFC